MDARVHTNHLADETSPYLLQHAHNPVDWYPWCDEALDKARRENKLILLSIGYSACHWCHVMAHESFEDAAIGALMNELYVCIKVDREERPDLDKVYQLTHQLMSRGAGGWPLTAFITPDNHTPLMIGTYYPPQPRHGLPSFTEVLRQVASYYRDNQSSLDAHHDAVVRALAQIEPGAATAVVIDEAPLVAAARQVAEYYDAENGGFGGAPKFPSPALLEFCLRETRRTSSRGRLYDIAMHTLQAMADGGFNDQLGGGFYRYTVDARWTIPHFEKMLYDNARLLPLYADASLLADEAADGTAAMAMVARRTARWVMDEMQAPGAEGGYYSSLDADSEGGEGVYYLWDDAELTQHLTADEYAVIKARYGLHGKPNFEGRWHLVVGASMDAVAAHCALAPDAVRTLHDSARHKLLALRRSRVSPALDDKSLCSWNALMIRGLARAGGVLDCDECMTSARRALGFVRTVLWRDGALLATSRNGRARQDAWLDDYVLLIDALLELLHWRFCADDLRWALQLADALLARFQDRENGAFFFTANDHEPLLHRHKPCFDDALPGGNGVAIRVLMRLAHITGNGAYDDAATAALRALWPGIVRHPFSHGSLLIALEEYLQPGRTIILRGTAPDMTRWRRALQRQYDPFTLCLAIPNEDTDLPGLLNARKPLPSGETVAYVCEGTHCEAPITDADEFESYVKGV